jgi:pseudaminic acid biosynthesis-associated methylase
VTSDDQLRNWTGDFGNQYIERNRMDGVAREARSRMWKCILDCLAEKPPRSILEVGANIGNNLSVLRELTDATLFGLEPNEKALSMMVANAVLPAERALKGAVQSIPLEDSSVDMVFTSGVLIHVAPKDLQTACREIVRVARRYVVCVEYFAPEPETKTYRGRDDLLFKNDFGGVYLDSFPNLAHVGNGFFWKRVTGLDNLTWWAFVKREGKG